MESMGSDGLERERELSGTFSGEQGHSYIPTSLWFVHETKVRYLPAGHGFCPSGVRQGDAGDHVSIGWYRDLGVLRTALEECRLLQSTLRAKDRNTALGRQLRPSCWSLLHWAHGLNVRSGRCYFTLGKTQGRVAEYREAWTLSLAGCGYLTVLTDTSTTRVATIFRWEGGNLLKKDVLTEHSLSLVWIWILGIPRHPFRGGMRLVVLVLARSGFLLV